MFTSARRAAVSVVAAAALVLGTMAPATAAQPLLPVFSVTAAPAAVVAGTPLITGTPKVGSTLRVKPGSWSGVEFFDYQWLADGNRVSGAVDETFTPRASHVGKRISVQVTGWGWDDELGDYEQVAQTSKATAKVAKGTLKAKTPAISGSVGVGSYLSVKPGTWTSGTKFTYQWYVNSKAVKGATKSTFAVKKSHLGDRLLVKVTGKKSGYTSVAKKSKTTAAVKKAAWPDTKYGSFAPKTVRGSGDDIINMPSGAKAGIVVATHDGDSNFIITSYDSDDSYTDLLVNEIGEYDGTVPFGLITWRGKNKYLEVQADGDWTIKILPFSMAPALPSSGYGDGVYRYTAKSGVTRKLTHNGDSNFIVTYFHGSDWDLLVNEIGSYSGRKRFVAGPGIVEIVADGRWTVKK